MKLLVVLFSLTIMNSSYCQQEKNSYLSPDGIHEIKIEYKEIGDGRIETTYLLITNMIDTFEFQKCVIRDLSQPIFFFSPNYDKLIFEHRNNQEYKIVYSIYIFF